jgi:hypothetical protein
MLRKLRVTFPWTRWLSLVSGLSAISMSAATSQVESIAALREKLASAVAGDVIVVKNGAYTSTEPLTVTRSGTADAPITVRAEKVGAVEISGTHGFQIAKPAAYVVVEGFVFSHAAETCRILAGSSHVRFTRNVFHCSGEGAEIDIAGDDAEVDHNEFRDKKVVGNMISVTGVGAQVARRTWIHHNYFHDYANAHANGAETIRFGRSFYSMSRGDGVVEYNLFVRCTGENELISNKACAITYRYNTLLDSPGAQLTLRHGNDCSVYGNILRGTDGLRIFGDRHHIYSNYFEGNTLGITIGNGDGEVADGAKLTCHDRPDDCVIVFNTLVNNRAHYVMIARKEGLGATRTTFANNLIVGGGEVAKIDGPYPGATWGGNLLWQTGGSPGALPPESYTSADPKLAPDERGVLHMQAGSPAIDTSEGEFDFVTTDLDGQARLGRKTKGADQFSAAPVVAHLLTPADVGPFSQ